jgi:hypothetical protein
MSAQWPICGDNRIFLTRIQVAGTFSPIATPTGVWHICAHPFIMSDEAYCAECWLGDTA